MQAKYTPRQYTGLAIAAVPHPTTGSPSQIRRRVVVGDRRTRHAPASGVGAGSGCCPKAQHEPIVCVAMVGEKERHSLAGVALVRGRWGRLCLFIGGLPHVFGL